jgi:hypothetical protein
MEKVLWANPVQQATQELKASQFAAPKTPKTGLPKQPRRRNQFFGE